MNKGDRIEPYLQRLYGYAFSLSRDPHQAEDLVQECALRALAARKSPPDEPAYRAWLFRILRNLFLDQVRKEKTASLAAQQESLALETEYWQGHERFITVLNVSLELEKLPQAQREIIALIDIVGLTYAETSQLLDVPIGTVMSRISRARRMLLDAIGSSNLHELPVRKTKALS
ncbi:MAG: sigma-70 family RNA polymerase sigma factor [Gammaproteobacteria bacterium]|nr:sigma-70 family RNA polymerase sigma factor [Gammaproteobacteria bacterium]NIM73219.1 sigma-70 family RNA polymerase sigma factor [Gammaproteobacteria bacterium]NIN40055.1 sigma-70 family RNA polymerase sigma factor [Gammaproteobacteria bacterium]NIO26269.1 sigma-70 family RNA polymerase sigma factor [Gammaproteobacteria bacterium]NIO66078.1 sigma-70 family RNA polymerase sigma factor [Gammaproteobacteria bacterium]